MSPSRRFSQREKSAHQHTSAHYQALHERQATRIQNILQPLPNTRPKQCAQNQRQVQRKPNRRQLCVIPRGNPHSQNGCDKINQQSPQKGLHPERRGVKQRGQNRLERIKARKVELQKLEGTVDVPEGGERVVAHAREGLEHVGLRIKPQKSAANEEGVEIRFGGRNLAQQLRSELLRFFLLLRYSGLTGKKRLLVGEGGIAG